MKQKREPDVQNIKAAGITKYCSIGGRTVSFHLQDVFTGEVNGKEELLDEILIDNMLEQMAKAVKGNCSRYNPVPDEIIIRKSGSRAISDNDKQGQQEPAQEIIESYEPRFSLGQVALNEEVREKVRTAISSKPKKDYLAYRLYLKKKKILSLCRDYEIKDRSLLQFQKMAGQIDVDMFCFYMGKIAGTGRYYKFSACEGIIRDSGYTKAQKDKMCDALKGIAQYKGIAAFLDHVEDETPTYPCMESMRKRVYALEALRNLQELGINPVNISVRKRLVSGSLPNLIEVYQEAVGKSPTLKAKPETMKKQQPKEKFSQELGDGEEAPFD